MVRLRPPVGGRCGLAIGLILAALGTGFTADAADAIRPGRTEVVARIPGAMLAGVALDNESRVYLSFPNRGNSPPPYALARVEKSGRLVPFPSGSAARYDEAKPQALISILGIRTDRAGQLWVLDNARPGSSLRCLERSS